MKQTHNLRLTRHTAASCVSRDNRTGIVSVRLTAARDLDRPMYLRLSPEETAQLSAALLDMCGRIQQ